LMVENIALYTRLGYRETHREPFNGLTLVHLAKPLDHAPQEQMQSPEIALYWRYIASSLDRLIACLDDLTIDDLNWKPLPSANSLAALAVHTMANAADNLLATLCGQDFQRDRDREFAALAADTTTIPAQWRLLRDRLQRALAEAPHEWLDQQRQHPRRGTVTGRDLLIIVARHAAEHLGQAELTRDLLRQARY
jgi:hypothetical protein